MDLKEVTGKLEDLRTKFRTMRYKLPHYASQTFESEYQADYEDIISVDQGVNQTLEGDKVQAEGTGDHCEPREGNDVQSPDDFPNDRWASKRVE